MPKVLLVTDEPWVRNQVRAALTQPSTTLLEEADPFRVPDLVLDERPDVVLIDSQIGTMGGMATTRAIRDAVLMRGAQPVRVVILLDRQADAFLAQRAGAASWLTKPFTSHQLQEAMDEGRVA
ncbi:MAG: response regulator [Actinomycetota bacterium]|nr:response regulator [Actinomycetota bacterium]